jgi:peptide-methionine (S)-S-oxide reductase
VGYAGGDKDNPTYYNLGFHSETIQIDYDPAVITYQELLNVFWDSHNPVVPSYSTQYASKIFYHDEEQRLLALESKQIRETESGISIYTDIVPYNGFHLAEDYHQKYYLRSYNLIINELKAIYPNTGDLISSTATARLNGYAGGYGDIEFLHDNLTGFGLSQEATELLLKIAGNGLVSGCAVPQN